MERDKVSSVVPTRTGTEPGLLAGHFDSFDGDNVCEVIDVADSARAAKQMPPQNAGNTAFRLREAHARGRHTSIYA